MQVPPIIIQMCKNQGAVSRYDMSSVGSIFTGAAPLGAETAEELQKIYPSWKIRQGYGEHFCIIENALDPTNVFQARPKHAP
jgi:acyl-coenzyme A synthetase/AMP-(fatty) acid ligase